MLAPLDRITAATRAAGSGALDHRIRLPGRDDEFRELADAFDAMLERLERHVAEQQRFAANASHELRTPLAITQTLLDVAAKDPDPDVDLLVERLRTVNTRAIDLTEALLVLSRADQRSFEREPVDLSLLAEEAAEVLLPLAEERGVTITTAGEAAATSASRALLLQLTTNLLHNAIVHNVPSGGGAWVTTRTTSSGVALVVENTGDRLDRRPRRDAGRAVPTRLRTAARRPRGRRPRPGDRPADRRCARRSARLSRARGSPCWLARRSVGQPCSVSHRCSESPPRFLPTTMTIRPPGARRGSHVSSSSCSASLPMRMGGLDQISSKTWLPGTCSGRQATKRESRPAARALSLASSSARSLTSTPVTLASGTAFAIASPMTP